LVLVLVGNFGGGRTSLDGSGCLGGHVCYWL
jgi:hypothetical protein